MTVSIAAETTGTLRDKFLENFEVKLTSDGSISEYAGTSKTSSKVSPVSMNLDLPIAIKNNCTQIYDFLLTYYKISK